jgi:hypothetical protein
VQHVTEVQVNRLLAERNDGRFFGACKIGDKYPSNRPSLASECRCMCCVYVSNRKTTPTLQPLTPGKEGVCSLMPAMSLLDSPVVPVNSSIPQGLVQVRLCEV